MTLTLEDLRPGQRLIGGSRTITDAEVALLPAIMGAINPLFHDEESARAGAMGRRVLYGPAILGIAIAATEPLLGDIVIGLIGITDLRFRHPVGVGDTITATLTVDRVEPRPEKRGDILVVRDEVVNQDRELVLELTRTIMVRRPS